MSIFDALVLGTVQGLTEFIPVSSTGHLILAEKFLGLPGDFTFGVLLNLGTLLALFIFFRRRIAEVVVEIFIKRNFKYLALLILATLPAGLVGGVFGDSFENLSGNAWLVTASLVVVGILMVVFGKERSHATVKKQSDIRVKGALLIGLAQVAALIPGVSRSGSTILAALNLKFSKEAAAEFSFMMAIPIILAATLKVLISSEGRGFMTNQTIVFLVGNIASFVFGILAVKFLIGVLKKHGLRAFGWYRIGLAAVLSVLLFTKVI